MRRRSQLSRPYREAGIGPGQLVGRHFYPIAERLQALARGQRVVALVLIMSVRIRALCMEAVQFRSFGMAFLVRLRIFHDQPIKGPLRKACGRLAKACAVIAPAAGH